MNGIGLALSGGGTLGFAHVGVLKALEEAHVPIAAISGTSAGSMVAAIYACGMRAAEMESVAYTFRTSYFDIDYWGIVKALFSRKKDLLGFLKGDRLQQWVRDLCGNRMLAEAEMPCALIATDLTCAEEVVFTTRPFTQPRHLTAKQIIEDAPIDVAVRASIAFPGAFQPVRRGNDLLVDGGLLNDLPVNVLHAYGCTITVGINLGYEGTPRPLNNLWDIANQSINTMIYNLEMDRAKRATVILDIQGTTQRWDQAGIRQNIQAGYDATLRWLDRIDMLLKANA
ncbi:MAG: patatin-like phospholipase family protein [Firmicutes bacterium]|nr:patatin-like phospholipase family protein [Bacillota bacterium]